MDILYHLTIAPPEMPGCEAVVQEVEALQSRFGGDLVYLGPNRRSALRVPRAAFGLHKLRRLRAREEAILFHHVFNPDPFLFPVLRGLRRPIIYSVTGGARSRRPNVAFLSSLAAITVTDRRSLERFRTWGLDNCSLVRPGIDTTRFTCSPIPLESEIRLMVGSAPWNQVQFRRKGIKALLLAARDYPRLHLVFLWRGVLAERMKRYVRRLNLEKQVEILNIKVDVNRVLAGVHASVSLTTHPSVIRPYPHSLMESLAAGKPVIVSRSITMSEYAERKGCGTVVETVSSAGILDAVEAMAREYTNLQEAAREVGQRDFSQEMMLASFQSVYDQSLESPRRR